MSVDFPDPDGPISAIYDPFSISISKPSRALTIVEPTV
jgi:hypothetical protein